MDTGSWSHWLGGAVASLSDATGVIGGRALRFPSARGLLLVREGHSLPHLHGTATRATGEPGPEEFDLRRLTAGSRQGGLVTLSALEALERESQLMSSVEPHWHVVRCHASIVENVGTTHNRLLLCDPCLGDLAGLLAAQGGVPPAAETARICHELAYGLGHLHDFGLLYGSSSLHGVLKGRDGYWKLGDFSRSARLPITAQEWRSQSCIDEKPGHAGPGLKDVEQGLPPETRRSEGCADLEASADIWLLGHLLGALLTGELGAARSPAAVAVPPRALLEALAARLWLLLHWLLMDSPGMRPCAKGVAAMLAALHQIEPEELLDDLPVAAQRDWHQTVAATARRLAVEQAVEAELERHPVVDQASAAARQAAILRARSAAERRLADKPLGALRGKLSDLAAFDLLCANCGLQDTKLCIEGGNASAGNDISASESNVDNVDPQTVPRDGLLIKAAALPSTDGSTEADSASDGDSAESCGASSRGALSRSLEQKDDAKYVLSLVAGPEEVRVQSSELLDLLA